jgi:hypothetical protein
MAFNWNNHVITTHWPFELLIFDEGWVVRFLHFLNRDEQTVATTWSLNYLNNLRISVLTGLWTIELIYVILKEIYLDEYMLSTWRSFVNLLFSTHGSTINLFSFRMISARMWVNIMGFQVVIHRCWMSIRVAISMECWLSKESCVGWISEQSSFLFNFILFLLYYF